MTNSRAGIKLQLLDNHLATGTEATYTYTPGTALNLKTQYREISVIITGSATAALGLVMKLNAVADNNLTEMKLDTTTVSGSVTDADPVMNLLPNSLVDGAVTFYAKVIIVCNDANDSLQIMSTATTPHEGLFIAGCEAQATATTITSIEIKTSTSTWIAGTEISIYGLQR